MAYLRDCRIGTLKVVRVAVHTISLLGAVVLVVIAILLLFLLGPVWLLILILAAVLFWYAFGPGSRGAVVVTTP
jgi:hypothetical protein